MSPSQLMHFFPTKNRYVWPKNPGHQRVLHRTRAFSGIASSSCMAECFTTHCRSLASIQGNERVGGLVGWLVPRESFFFLHIFGTTSTYHWTMGKLRKKPPNNKNASSPQKKGLQFGEQENLRLSFSLVLSQTIDTSQLMMCWGPRFWYQSSLSPKKGLGTGIHQHCTPQQSDGKVETVVACRCFLSFVSSGGQVYTEPWLLLGG